MLSVVECFSACTYCLYSVFVVSLQLDYLFYICLFLIYLSQSEGLIPFWKIAENQKDEGY